ESCTADPSASRPSALLHPRVHPQADESIRPWKWTDGWLAGRANVDMACEPQRNRHGVTETQRTMLEFSVPLRGVTRASFASSGVLAIAFPNLDWQRGRMRTDLGKPRDAGGHTIEL